MSVDPTFPVIKRLVKGLVSNTILSEVEKPLYFQRKGIICRWHRAFHFWAGRITAEVSFHDGCLANDFIQNRFRAFPSLLPFLEDRFQLGSLIGFLALCTVRRQKNTGAQENQNNVLHPSRPRV